MSGLLALIVAFLVGIGTYFLWPTTKSKKQKSDSATQTPVPPPKSKEVEKQPAPSAPEKVVQDKRSPEGSKETDNSEPKKAAEPKRTAETKTEAAEPEKPTGEPDMDMEEKKDPEEEVAAVDGEELTLGPYDGTVMSHIVGPHGSTIKGIFEATGSKLDLNNETGIVTVSGGDTAKAKQMVEKIVEEQAHPDYEGKKGKALRARADSMRRESKASFAEAQAAFDAGDKSKGHELMAKVKSLNEKSKETDLKAAQAIFSHRNKGHDLKFDLHGLHVQEALDIFEQELNHLQEEEKSGRVLEVIPGAGHHSKGGESHAKLKPAVMKFLREKNLETHEHNAGSVFVNLDGLEKEAFDAKCEELS